jgi:hypothetical protein
LGELDREWHVLHHALRPYLDMVARTMVGMGAEMEGGDTDL